MIGSAVNWKHTIAAPFSPTSFQAFLLTEFQNPPTIDGKQRKLIAYISAQGEGSMIDYADFFPFWRDLDGPQRDTLRNAITLRHVLNN